MFRKFFALIFSFVFLVFFLLFSFLFSFEKTFFEKEFYLNNDFVSNSYQYLSDFSYNLFSEKYGENLITKVDFLNHFSSVFSKEDLKTEISKNLDFVLLSKVNPDTYDVEIVFPLNFLKNYKDKFNSVLSPVLFKELPKCSDVSSGNVCVPDLVDFSLFNKEFVREFDRAFYGSMPEDFSVVWHVGNDFSGNLLDVYKQTKFYIFSFSLILLFSLICLISLILFSPITLILKWISGLMFISSGFCLLLFTLILNSKFVYEGFSKILSGNDFVLSVFDLFLNKFLLCASILLLPIATFSFIVLFLVIYKEYHNGKL